MAKKSTQKMDETVSEGLFKTMQEKPTSWNCRQDDSIWTSSTNTNNYVLGRNLSVVHVLHQTPYKECVSREPGEISCTEVGNSAQMDKREGREEKATPNRDKSDLFSSEQQVGEIYVRSIGSGNTKTANNNASVGSQYITTGSSRVKGTTNADIQVGEHCFNKRRTETLQTPLGELRRICPIGSVVWNKCQFVYPYNKSKECDNNTPMLQMSESNRFDVSRAAHEGTRKSPMVVEIISNETDRRRIETFLQVEFDANNDYYLDEIYEFGFTHIIILGTFEFGPVFLDCYGRVFQMDSMSDVLWFIGNSLEEAWSQEVAWIVEEDGSVYESKIYPKTDRGIVDCHVFENQNNPKVKKIQRKVQKNKGKRKKSKKNSTVF